MAEVVLKNLSKSFGSDVGIEDILPTEQINTCKIL